jgi:replicative DNA helicase
MDRTDVKILPRNIEAEQALIGAMFINPSCISAIANEIEPTDCYNEAHIHIMQSLFDLKEKADLITVVQNLREKGLLEQVGGKEYLGSIADAVSTSAGYRYHIDIVKRLSTRRKLIHLCSTISDSCYQLTQDENEIEKTLRQGLSDLYIGQKHYSGVDISNIYNAEEMLKEYEQYIVSLRKNRFITGISEIDKRIRGVNGGEVLFIIARAGSFKTALLQNMLLNYIKNSAWGALFYSLEMPIASLTERYHEIVQGSSGREIEEIYKSTENGALIIKKSLEQSFKESLKNLFIVPTRVSILDIEQYMQLTEKKFQIKIGVIGIDYLGLMDGPGKNEYEIVSQLARDIKNLAKKINLPIVVLAQTSRKAGSGEVEISLDMGRGSGAIEEAADFVLGMFQIEKEKLMIEGDELEYELICKILKNRKGSKGSRWKLDLDPTNLRIGAEAEKWEPPKKRKNKFE